jgi:hypothetical protein
MIPDVLTLRDWVADYLDLITVRDPEAPITAEVRRSHIPVVELEKTDGFVLDVLALGHSSQRFDRATWSERFTIRVVCRYRIQETLTLSRERQIDAFIEWCQTIQRKLYLIQLNNVALEDIQEREILNREIFAQDKLLITSLDLGFGTLYE